MSENTKSHLSAFSGFGIELEYMIVDDQSLSVRPLAERLLVDTDGLIQNEVEHGEIAWSNELVSHVLELKTNGPAAELSGLADKFHADIQSINTTLRAHGALLLPTAMHPLFDPARETRLWPYGQKDIYQAYDRIFGCAGHGWSNLQSMHINLPFANDQEFTRLHAAIRVVLPLIPALSASSPIEQGRRAGWLDNRLRYYRDNQKRVPWISGPVIPEPVSGIEDYHRTILEPMYAEISPFDPEHVLNDDWLNSRAAIARFERQTIEIRIIDLQECPAADLAIAELVVALIRALYEQQLADFDAQQALSTPTLANLLWSTASVGARAVIEEPELLAFFGLHEATRVGELWSSLLASLTGISPDGRAILEQMIRLGPLSDRILKRVGGSMDHSTIIDCYRELGQCLAEQRLFGA